MPSNTPSVEQCLHLPRLRTMYKTSRYDFGSVVRFPPQQKQWLATGMMKFAVGDWLRYPRTSPTKRRSVHIWEDSFARTATPRLRGGAGSIHESHDQPEYEDPLLRAFQDIQDGLRRQQNSVLLRQRASFSHSTLGMLLSEWTRPENRAQRTRWSGYLNMKRHHLGLNQCFLELLKARALDEPKREVWFKNGWGIRRPMMGQRARDFPWIQAKDGEVTDDDAIPYTPVVWVFLSLDTEMEHPALIKKMRHVPGKFYEDTTQLPLPRHMITPYGRALQARNLFRHVMPLDWIMDDVARKGFSISVPALGPNGSGQIELILLSDPTDLDTNTSPQKECAPALVTDGNNDDSADIDSVDAECCWFCVQ